MRWSFKIGSLFGIPLRVHVTFLIPLLLAAREPSGLAAVTLLGLVFVCVVLHELGHSLVARRYGIGVESITLLPIGGVASLRGPAPSPRAELLMAAAGPAVSIGLGVGLFLTAHYLYSPAVWRAVLSGYIYPPVLAELALINFSLAAFNLVPAFPMDGGRVLRAILWRWKGFLRGTAIAARIGQILAVGAFILALTHSNPYLVLIAVFIYFGADAEGKAAGWVRQFAAIPVTEAMQADLRSIAPSDRVGDTARLMAQTGQEHFPVRDDHGPVGILTRSNLFQALRRQEFDRPVGDCMTKELIYCQPTDNLAGVIHQMDRRNLACVLVMDGDQILGLITPEHLYRILNKDKDPRRL